ncbi:hypothetical protein VCHA53O466_50248 [Vibrio chagasii]|nr:hypothetical protein VCHA53O466_50248 [Vibrio chagasii]
MSRYIFTPQGALNLKNTISESVNFVDNFYWISRFFSLSVKSMYLSEAIGLPHSSASSIVQEQPRFKPAHTKLLNAISQLFGYKTYNELKTVANSGVVPSSYIEVGDSDYQNAIVEIFSELTKAHFSLEDETSGGMNVAISLLINAWQLNKDLVPYHEGSITIDSRERHRTLGDPMFSSVTIVAKDGEYKIGTYSIPDLKCLSDETYKGRLLPIFSRFDIMNVPLSALTNLAMISKSTARLATKDGKFTNAALIHGINSIISQDDKTVFKNHMTKYHHAIEDIWSTASEAETENVVGESGFYSSMLAAFLHSFQDVHRSMHDYTEWFVKPHTPEERVTMMTMGNVSKTQFNDTTGKFEYKKA